MLYLVYSLPITLDEGKATIITELDNEKILVKKGDFCYKVISEANSFNPLKREFRTITLDFGKNSFPPVRVMVYTSSYEDSFGIEHRDYYRGKPHVTEIDINHHSFVSFKVKKTIYSKEKHMDCEEETIFEKLENMLIP